MIKGKILEVLCRSDEPISFTPSKFNEPESDPDPVDLDTMTINFLVDTCDARLKEVFKSLDIIVPSVCSRELQTVQGSQTDSYS